MADRLPNARGAFNTFHLHRFIWFPAVLLFVTYDTLFRRWDPQLAGSWILASWASAEAFAFASSLSAALPRERHRLALWTSLALLSYLSAVAVALAAGLMRHAATWPSSTDHFALLLAATALMSGPVLVSLEAAGRPFRVRLLHIVPLLAATACASGGWLSVDATSYTTGALLLVYAASLIGATLSFGASIQELKVSGATATPSEDTVLAEQESLTSAAIPTPTESPQMPPMPIVYAGVAGLFLYVAYRLLFGSFRPILVLSWLLCALMVGYGGSASVGLARFTPAPKRYSRSGELIFLPAVAVVVAVAVSLLIQGEWAITRQYGHWLALSLAGALLLLPGCELARLGNAVPVPPGGAFVLGGATYASGLLGMLLARYGDAAEAGAMALYTACAVSVVTYYQRRLGDVMEALYVSDTTKVGSGRPGKRRKPILGRRRR